MKTENNKVEDYVVAIPSYNRADVIVKKTLNTLQKGQVNQKKIYIFVANEKQHDLYKKIIPNDLYNQIIIGKLGITQQRNYISSYFSQYQYIISIDDDVEAVEKKVKGSDKLVVIHNLDEFFIDAGKKLIKKKLFIWGIYPVHNSFFMKSNETTDRRFIIGVLFGYINRPNLKEIKSSIKSETKEDYEQTILYYKHDGGVLRFNNITVKTKFHAEGGLGKNRSEKNKKSAKYLKKKYPNIVTIFHRKNGMTEIRLSRHDENLNNKTRKIKKHN